MRNLTVWMVSFVILFTTSLAFSGEIKKSEIPLGINEFYSIEDTGISIGYAGKNGNQPVFIVREEQMNWPGAAWNIFPSNEVPVLLATKKHFLYKNEDREYYMEIISCDQVRVVIRIRETKALKR